MAASIVLASAISSGDEPGELTIELRELRTHCLLIWSPLAAAVLNTAPGPFASTSMYASSSFEYQIWSMPTPAEKPERNT